MNWQDYAVYAMGILLGIVCYELGKACYRRWRWSRRRRFDVDAWAEDFYREVKRWHERQTK